MNVKERGLSLVEDMTIAALEDRKTHTRRTNGLERVNKSNKWDWAGIVTEDFSTFTFVSKGGHIQIIKCPYGKPGDIFYVKENYKIDTSYVFEGRVKGFYTADNKPFNVILSNDEWKRFRERKKPFMKTPGRFMYKSLSRIKLRIKDIRVERIQDITEADAWSEGCKRGTPTDNGGYFPAEEAHPGGGTIGWDHPQDWFADLWNSINAIRGYSWESNPYVWVIVFERIK